MIPFYSKVFALSQEEEEGEWERSELCMGDESVCTDGLVGIEREKHILSFGEDEEGELYMLVTSLASTTSRGGVVYHIVDPARSVMYYRLLSMIYNDIIALFTTYMPGDAMPAMFGNVVMRTAYIASYYSIIASRAFVCTTRNVPISSI